MASKNMTTETTNTDMDYAQHNATWAGFIRLGKWAIGILVVLLVVLYFVINP